MSISKENKLRDKEESADQGFISPKLQNFIFSFGAAIVVFGALCKVYHVPNLGWMLGAGLAIEVFVFIISAFQPVYVPPREFDWSKVYPELDEEKTDIPARYNKSSGSGVGDLFEKADISPELLAKLKSGIQDLTNTARGLSEISSATLATELYVKDLGNASRSLSSFSEVNNKATHSVERSLGSLVESYEHSSQLISSSSKEMAHTFAESTKKINPQLTSTSEKLSSSYKEFTESVHKDFSVITENSKSYSGEISKLNSNLASLNSSYELHLQNVKKLADTSSKSVTDQAGLQQMVNQTMEEAKKYQQQTELMNKNLEALNQVYGNMLGAMSIKR
jgi:gliding motility-associated protein GldL